MVELVALKTRRIGTKRVLKGDRFTVTKTNARLLVATGTAKIAEPRHEPVRPEKPARRAMPSAAAAEASSSPVADGDHDDGLEALTLSRLRERAAALGVPNYSRMRKADLLIALREYERRDMQAAE